MELKEGFVEHLPEAGKLCEFSATVSSERLDCVVSVLIGASRKAACEKIEESMVSLNSVLVQKTTLKVKSGDVVTVRSKGKCIIDSLEEKTKKDRLVLRYKKYI